MLLESVGFVGIWNEIDRLRLWNMGFSFSPSLPFFLSFCTLAFGIPFDDCDDEDRCCVLLYAVSVAISKDLILRFSFPQFSVYFRRSCVPMSFVGP